MTQPVGRRPALALPFLIAARPAAAQPAPHDGVCISHDVRFSTGDSLSELRVGYTTLGDPRGMPVLVLHGTGGSGRAMLNPNFGGQLFGPGQPLDAARHFIILPDAIGSGRSSKPSDGLGPDFPRYTYADMVAAQHRLVTEGLGLRQLRLVIGNSMGGMHAWLWAVTFPGMMQAVVPMACQPTAMAGRNWMLRRLMIESIRRDPAYAGGRYTQQPPSLRTARAFYGAATNGGTLNLATRAPDMAAADALVERALAALPPADANDVIWQWDAARDYDPSPRLDRVTAQVLAINAADDERNPPETGLTEAALRRVPNARLLLIPASAETSGHATTGNARFYAAELRRFLAGLG